MFVLTVTIDIQEAKTHLSELLQRVMMGEEIIIAKSGQPVARLVPFSQTTAQRSPGSAEGQIWMAPDFDAPLTADMLDSFEEK